MRGRELAVSGAILNSLAIFAGTLIGIIFGAKFTTRMRDVLFAILGTFVIFLGIDMFFESRNQIIPLISAAFGTLVGEILRLEAKAEAFGVWLQAFSAKLTGNPRLNDAEVRRRFVNGFVTATLVYLIGPIGILGSIQAGLNGNYELLIVKSILDGVSSIVFASALGIGVGFSSLPVFVFQVIIVVFASQFQSILTDGMIAEMTGTGGILLGLIGISSLLNLKKIPAASTVPAIFIAPILALVIEKFP